MDDNARPRTWLQTLRGDQWRALVGVTAGYTAACGLIFVGFFVLPYLLLAA